MALLRNLHSCSALPAYRKLPSLCSGQLSAQPWALQGAAAAHERQPSSCAPRQACLHSSQPGEAWSRLRGGPAQRCKPVSAVKERDPGSWDHSPEWMGNQGGGWGRDAGQRLPLHVLPLRAAHEDLC